MIYGSVCSGIEAATVAWDPLGWKPAFFSEIEKFPSAVLAHHYGSNMPDKPYSSNGVPNYGDMTKFKEWPDHGKSSCPKNRGKPIDVLVGGTPCQSFSVAGLRKGLDDPRGNLALTYLAIAERYKPRWLVWENVPGVLSSNGGRDFGAFLGALAKLGYGFAYRVLDAQYVRVDGFTRAVPQRRRRVFVVGYLGDWRRAAAVLFERESLFGDSPPRRETGQGTSLGVEIGPSGGDFTDVNPTLDTRAKDGPVRNQLAGCAMVASTLNAHFGEKQGLEDQHVNAGCPLFVSEGCAASLVSSNMWGDQDGRESHLVAFDCKASGQNGFGVHGSGGEISPTLRAMGHSKSHNNGGGQVAVAFDVQQITCPHNKSSLQPISPTMAKVSRLHAVQNWAVRRLTPWECARLQGFPDDHCRIPWRGKTPENCPDGPQYKAYGNSMAVNVMRWIGRRIEMADKLEIAA